MLLGLASKQLGVPVSRLTVRAGIVSDKDDASKKVAYGDLLGGKTFSAPNTGRAPLKPVTEYRLVGQRVKRKDTPAKVDGSHPYVHQLRLPGMLHGRVVRPRGQGPYGVIDKPLSVDESSIKNIKGARVVRKGDFIGVVAANEQDAIQAATQLKVKWSESKTMPGNGNLWKHFREAKPNDRFTRNTGSVDKGIAGGGERARGELLDLLPGPRLVRPLVRRRRRQAGQGQRLGREPEHLRQPDAGRGPARDPGRTRSRSTSPRVRAATAATSRTTRRLPPR